MSVVTADGGVVAWFIILVVIGILTKAKVQKVNISGKPNIWLKNTVQLFIY